jgi:hypothetical protein
MFICLFGGLAHPPHPSKPTPVWKGLPQAEVECLIGPVKTRLQAMVNAHGEAPEYSKPLQET